MISDARRWSRGFGAQFKQLENWQFSWCASTRIFHQTEKRCAHKKKKKKKTKMCFFSSSFRCDGALTISPLPGDTQLHIRVFFFSLSTSYFSEGGVLCVESTFEPRKEIIIITRRQLFFFPSYGPTYTQNVFFCIFLFFFYF